MSALAWKCQLCHAGFYTSKLLAMHMSAFHKEEPITTAQHKIVSPIVFHDYTYTEQRDTRQSIEIDAENKETVMNAVDRKRLEDKFNHLKVLRKTHKVSDLSQLTGDDTEPPAEQTVDNTLAAPKTQDSFTSVEDTMTEEEGYKSAEEPREGWSQSEVPVEDGDYIVVVNEDGIYMVERDNLKQEITSDNEENNQPDEYVPQQESEDSELDNPNALAIKKLMKTGVLDIKQIQRKKLFGHTVKGVKAVIEFKCLRCDEVFPTKHERRMHLETHNNDLRFFCSECGRGFRRKQGLILHSNVHTEGSHHQCPHCHNYYRTDRYLKEHVKLHMPEEYKFQCTICAKLFAQRTSLNYHMTTHTNIKPFKCSLCDKAYRQRVSLEAHMNLHAGVRPYTCPTCGKGFRMKHTLSDHQRLHNDERPHVCKHPGCERKYAVKSQLKVHMKVHSGVKSYVCTVEGCSKRFFFSSHLNRHQTTAHKVKYKPTSVYTTDDDDTTMLSETDIMIDE